MLWVALHFQELPLATLEAIAAWACQFTPKVSLEPPAGLLLELEGSLRLFGGVERLCERLKRGLAEIGFEPALALAPTARAALWLARSEEEALERVPVEATCEREALAFLKSIGIRTVGELLALPRGGLALRCGERLVGDLDRALGREPEPRAFFSPPASFAAKLELPASVVHAEALLFAARRLLAQLEGLLVARHAGLRRFTLVLFDEEGQTIVEVGLASAARDKERLGELLRERLQNVVLKRPVEAIGLEARDFEPLSGTAAGLFADAAREAEDWAQLLERLRARLGHEAVYGLTPHPDHRPEHAWQRVEPGEWDPREYRDPGPRPAWLMHPARALGEGSFELLAGPERIEAGWWDGDEAARDYFVARLADASLGWVYREGEGWFLHGLFA